LKLEAGSWKEKENKLEAGSSKLEGKKRLEARRKKSSNSNNNNST